jgi:hypothetical protein
MVQWERGSGMSIGISFFIIVMERVRHFITLLCFVLALLALAVSLSATLNSAADIAFVVAMGLFLAGVIVRWI